MEAPRIAGKSALLCSGRLTLSEQMLGKMWLSLERSRNLENINNFFVQSHRACQSPSVSSYHRPWLYALVLRCIAFVLEAVLDIYCG